MLLCEPSPPLILAPPLPPPAHLQKNVTYGVYALTLKINPVMVEDEQRDFVLMLENSEGVTELEFKIATGEAPPPEGNGQPADDGPPGTLTTGQRMGDETNGKDELNGDTRLRPWRRFCELTTEGAACGLTDGGGRRGL